MKFSIFRPCLTPLPFAYPTKTEGSSISLLRAPWRERDATRATAKTTPRQLRRPFAAPRRRRRRHVLRVAAAEARASSQGASRPRRDAGREERALLPGAIWHNEALRWVSRGACRRADRSTPKRGYSVELSEFGKHRLRAVKGRVDFKMRKD